MSDKLGALGIGCFFGVILFIIYQIVHYEPADPCKGIVYGKTYNIKSGFYSGYKIDTHKEGYSHVFGEVTTKGDVVVGYLNVMCEDIDKGN